MDYTHKLQPDEQAFFTTGAGNDFERESTPQPENNLDLSNSAAEWVQPVEKNSPATERGSITFSPEEIPQNPANIPENATEVALAMPPGVADPFLSPEPEPSKIETSVNLDNLHTNEHLSRSGMQEVDNAMEMLNKDGDIAKFYDTARAMMQANLKNSFGREVGL